MQISEGSLCYFVDTFVRILGILIYVAHIPSTKTLTPFLNNAILYCTVLYCTINKQTNKQTNRETTRLLKIYSLSTFHDVAAPA